MSPENAPALITDDATSSSGTLSCLVMLFFSLSLNLFFCAVQANLSKVNTEC